MPVVAAGTHKPHDIACVDALDARRYAAHHCPDHGFGVEEITVGEGAGGGDSEGAGGGGDGEDVDRKGRLGDKVESEVVWERVSRRHGRIRRGV